MPPADVIGETLVRASQPQPPPLGTIQSQLAPAIAAGLSPAITDAELALHPLSIWIETRLGLTWEDAKWVRARPQALQTAMKWFSEDSGMPAERCSDVLRQFLLVTSMAESDRQSGHNNGKRGFFAFKLPRFALWRWHGLRHH